MLPSEPVVGSVKTKQESWSETKTMRLKESKLVSRVEGECSVSDNSQWFYRVTALYSSFNLC